MFNIQVSFMKYPIIFLSIISAFVLTSCDAISSKKIKSLTELTPELSVQNNEPISFNANTVNPFEDNKASYKSYKLSSYGLNCFPITAKKHVYSLDKKGQLSAFSIENKKTVWTYKFQNHTSHNYIGGGITHLQGKLLVTNGSRLLTIFDALTGHEIISKEFPDIIRIKPVPIDNNIVLIQTVSNQLIAYDIQKAAILWQHEGLFETLSSNSYVAPIVYSNTILVNYSSGQVFGLDSQTGREKWSTMVSFDQTIGIPSFEASAISCAPILEKNFAYLASGLGKIIKIDLDNGQIIWSTKAQDIQSMSMIGDHLFIATNAKQLAALNPNNGNISWVGDLTLNKNKKNNKSALLLAPFPTETGGKKEINVISNMGNMFSFALNNGELSSIPTVKNIPQKIQFCGSSCCANGLYAVTDNSVIFFGEK
jgi:outer membrane protein assembly factor BamB